MSTLINRTMKVVDQVCSGEVTKFGCEVVFHNQVSRFSRSIVYNESDLIIPVKNGNMVLNYFLQN